MAAGVVDAPSTVVSLGYTRAGRHAANRRRCVTGSSSAVTRSFVWRDFTGWFGGSGESDDEGGTGSFDDVVGDGVELVDLHDPAHLGEEPVDEAEVAAGNSRDRRDGLRVGEVVGVEGLPELSPVAFKDELQFILSERSVLVSEAHSTVELRVSTELLLESGHADEHDGDVVTVVAVAQHFQGRGVEAFRFVDNDQFDVLVCPGYRTADLAGLA